MRIEHVAIWVLDIECTRQFFGKYFGATAPPRYDNAKGFCSYFLTLPDGNTRIEIMQQHGMAVEISHSTGHIAISVGLEEEVDRLTKISQMKDTDLSADLAPPATATTKVASS